MRGLINKQIFICSAKENLLLPTPGEAEEEKERGDLRNVGCVMAESKLLITIRPGREFTENRGKIRGTEDELVR